VLLLADAAGLFIPNADRFILLKEVAQPDNKPSELKMIEYLIQALFIVYLQY
jgi:hypothetical protein